MPRKQTESCFPLVIFAVLFWAIVAAAIAGKPLYIILIAVGVIAAGSIVAIASTRATGVRDQTNSIPLAPGITSGDLPVVYLLKAGPYYKIGRASVFDKRFGQIRLQLPFPVEVVHKIRTADPVKLERLWHSRFATKRKNGEWFELTESDVAQFVAEIPPW